MDLLKLQQIKDYVLTFPQDLKSCSDEFCGIFLHSNSPFTLKDYLAPIHSFRAFSQFNYPILFFISLEAINDEFDEMLKIDKYITPIIINTLNDHQAFNNFEINNLLYLIPPKFERLLYLQSDGCLLRSGWESMCYDYDWLGAKWKEPIQVLENTFNLPAVQVGNGGFNFRRRSKCLEVLEIVYRHGGQQKIVQGLNIYKTPVQRQNGWYLAEDIFFCFFGFGLGIFKPVSLETADKFAHEPILFDLAVGNSLDKPYGFHRCDF